MSRYYYITINSFIQIMREKRRKDRV